MVTAALEPRASSREMGDRHVQYFYQNGPAAVTQEPCLVLCMRDTCTKPFNDSIKQVLISVVLQVRKGRRGSQQNQDLKTVVCVTSNPLRLSPLQLPDSYFNTPRTFQNVSCLQLGKRMGKLHKRIFYIWFSSLTQREGRECLFFVHTSLPLQCTQMTLSKFIWELFRGSSHMFSRAGTVE